MQTPYPNRYKIVERGRRLVTIDTQTGLEMGLSGNLLGDPFFGHRQQPEKSTETRDGALPTQNVSAISVIEKSAMSTSIVQSSHRLPPSATRGLIALICFIMLVMFLIWTSLWAFVGALFIIPFTRALMIGALKSVYERTTGWITSG